MLIIIIVYVYMCHNVSVTEGVMSYSVLMLDEAHERTIQTDIVIGLLKKVFSFSLSLLSLCLSPSLSLSLSLSPFLYLSLPPYLSLLLLHIGLLMLCLSIDYEEERRLTFGNILCNFRRRG